MQTYLETVEGLDMVDHLCRLDIPGHKDTLRNIYGFHGRCIGDSAATIRSDVLRLIALQVAGMINDVKGWVEDAISQLQRAGAHVCVFAETRIQTTERHHSIVNAFKVRGYIAISHNAATQRSTNNASPEDVEFGPRSAGVILVVSASHISGWANVALDPHGRAIAASLDAQDGSTIRIIGVYGVSGASCVNFLSFPAKSKAECLLNEFMLSQFKYCSQNGAHAVVAGDLNSYQKPVLDNFGSPSAIRPECITSQLTAHGFSDSFRQRHPSVQAFTHISKTGGSRLDQIWVRPSLGLAMPIALSCIVWEWDTQSDHCPVIADVVCKMPLITTPVSMPQQPPWRSLLAKFNDDEHRDDIIAAVAKQIAPHKGPIEVQRHILATLRQSVASGAPLDPAQSRGAIESAFLSIEKNMLDAIPWPPAAKRTYRSRCPWQRCVRLLAHLQKLSTARSRQSTPRVRGAIGKLNKAWQRGLHITTELAKSRLTRPLSPNAASSIHPFYSSPSSWASGIGFPSPAAVQWVNSRCDFYDVTASNTVDPLVGYPQKALSYSEWQQEQSHQVLLAPLRALAKKAASFNLRTISSDYILQRRAALRRADISKWSRLIKPASKLPVGFSTSRFTTPEGSLRSPHNSEEACEGARQEWAKLMVEREPKWQHPLISQYVDSWGRPRGSINLKIACLAPPNDPIREIATAYMGPSDSGYFILYWSSSSEAVILSESSVSIRGTLLSKVNGSWRVDGPPLCSAASGSVVCICGEIPSKWDMVRWLRWSRSHSFGGIVYESGWTQWGDLTGPLSLPEKKKIIQGSRHSRPGPSYWKIAFLDFFRTWAQEAYWDLIDTQRICRIITPSIKNAIQVHLDKPSGGFRPLTMLEESFKAIEGPPARRKARTRSEWDVGVIFYAFNLAGEIHKRATTEVLCLDALVCEDATLFNMPFSRTPTDYEKFFNIIQTAACEAVEECFGIPGPASELTAEAFCRLSITIETRWGRTCPLIPTRGMVQGSVSGPEQAKPAQSPILALRAASKACYRTSRGREVRAAGFVDDTQHYGSGGPHLCTIMGELSRGSIATGIGFSWNKFTAYSSDWEDALCNIGFPFTAKGIYVSGWDIWNGQVMESFVPRSFSGTLEKLFGKRGTILDRHITASIDTVVRISALRNRIGTMRASWDEAAMMWQLIARGVVGYVPLVGTPSPSSLHDEDTAYLLLVLSRLGARSCLERMSLTAPRNIGGFQLPSIVECTVASVASELLYLLNGSTLASQLARDSLLFAMLEDPSTLLSAVGLVSRAMTFLAGYGIYVIISTDRQVGRMLDFLASRHKDIGHPLVGRFNAQAFDQGKKFCRVGRLANTIRRAIHSLKSNNVPMIQWRKASTWARVIPTKGCVDCLHCKEAFIAASRQSTIDWASECQIFGASPTNDINENWDGHAWDNPSSPDLDLRAQHLDAPSPIPDDEFGFFGDGGFDMFSGASFSAEARLFQDNHSYFITAIGNVARVSSRLPSRYGYEECTVHTAELSAMVTSLRWAYPGKWNLFVGDRSALFSALREASDPAPQWPNKSASLPFEGRLRKILARHSTPGCFNQRVPRWRRDQVDHPDKWNVKTSLVPGGDPRWMSRIAFEKYGLVGVDVKSHQYDSAFPYPVIKEGNDAQDLYCSSVNTSLKPSDVFLPSGGPFAFLCRDGRMVTRSSNVFVRNLLRTQSSSAMALRPTQGYLAKLKGTLYPHSLDIRIYTSCPIPPQFDGLLLPSDNADMVDLSSIIFRMQRAVGGAWTEYLKSDPMLRQLATSYHVSHRLPSVRTCPFCRFHHGTPRHYVMECPETVTYTYEICDSVEAILSNFGSPSDLIDAATQHYDKLASPFLFDPPASSIMRWPILSAWKLLIRNPAREDVLRTAPDGQLDPIQESAFDLAYRAVLPAALGYAIHKAEYLQTIEDSYEEDATIFSPTLILQETERRAKLWKSQKPTTMVVTILALGLRKLRAELRRRTDAWKIMATIEYPPSLSAAPPIHNVALSIHEEPLRVRTAFQSSFDQWFNTGGIQYIRSMRWAIPTVEAAVSRFRSTAPFSSRVSDSRIASSLSGAGVPFDSPDGITWGNGFATWNDAIHAMVTACECVSPALSDSPGPLKRCSQCYGQVMAGVTDMVAKCSLCKTISDLVCAVCSQGFHVGRSFMCHGANRAYRASELEGVVVCPDCLWMWTKSLALRSDDLSDAQQSEVRAIMERAATPSQALHLSIYEFVKEYVHNHTASEQDLAQAIQGLNLPYLTCDATTAVNQLICSGTLELREGRCCWKISVQPPCNASHQRPRKKARRGH